ncbi:hypothetical protein [Exiguobacterium aurantiacum]|uniref:Pyridoxamine 5'-phosphate oxidase putative domain-containing protein n=1 Tax=Exiguobacterium aurantiacum TaxID=33987 RepID=A0ABY5FK28_9BACL|nr:hypothetical protein [Exiguobacterium aurantiacum]UTT41907.1 hypothetical protein NMQ00_10075 [Exiguobacterium aurantiacum]
MASKAAFELSRTQQDTLNEMPLMFLVTFDEPKRWPITHAISWVQAPNEMTIRFALTKNSHLITLLANEKTASLIFLEGGLAYSIALSHVHEFEPSVKPALHLRFFEGKVEEVRNISFYGATYGQPDIIKTYDVEAAEKLDREVKESLNS